MLISSPRWQVDVEELLGGMDEVPEEVEPLVECLSRAWERVEEAEGIREALEAEVAPETAPPPAHSAAASCPGWRGFTIAAPECWGWTVSAALCSWVAEVGGGLGTTPSAMCSPPPPLALPCPRPRRWLSWR